MVKTAKLLFVSAAVAAGVASPAFAGANNNSHWRKTSLYDVASPLSDSAAFDPGRAGGGSFGYNVNANVNY